MSWPGVRRKCVYRGQGVYSVLPLTLEEPRTLLKHVVDVGFEKQQLLWIICLQ